jgi:uncharacterized protein
MARRAQPERTCVACRGRAAKGELIRVVRAPDGRVAVDPTGRSSGRGAYVHRSEECLRQAMRRGSLGRALKVSLGDAEVGRLVQELSNLVGEDA